MKFSTEHFVPCWPTALAFINMSLQCQHNLSSSTQNQISTTESAVKLQETAAIFSYPILPMTIHTLQKYNAAPKKHAKFAGRIQLFPLHHQKTKTKQKHSHTPDNGRVRLRRGIKFLVGYHQKKKSFLCFSLRHHKMFEPNPKLSAFLIFLKPILILFWNFFYLQKTVQTTKVS